jgi:glycine/D-amino acid oxidase-like deaminating enzyme
MGRVEADIDLSILSERIWEPLDIRAGYKTGYRKNGGVYPCDTRAELDEWAKWTRDVAEPRGVDSIILTRAQLEALLPGGKRDFVGGLYTKSDGCAEPFWAAPAIAKGAQDKGAKVFTNCAARGIETSGGVVSGVVTEKGRVGCKTVVLATGAWTRSCRPSPWAARPISAWAPRISRSASALMAAIPWRAEMRTRPS